MQTQKREIYKFINEYFKEIDDISEFHLNFFLKHKIQTIDLNTLILQKFIFQAFNFLKTNTGLYFSTFLNKLAKDVKNLIDYLYEFEKQTQVINNIFENKFLKTLPEYNLLKTKIEENKKLLHVTSTNIASLETQIKFFNPKNKEDESELKRLKGRLVDAIHYNAKAKDSISAYTIELNNIEKSLREIFFEEFSTAKTSYISKLKLVINTKLYYFNKQMWIEANKSKKTLSYLEDLGIKSMNLNVYIHNYLKHIDIARSQNYELYSKIEEVLKELNE